MNPLLRIFDPLNRTDDRAPEAYRFAPEMRSWAVLIGLGVALFGVTLVLGMSGSEEGHLFSQRFYFVYLISWIFCVTVSLGGMFFVMMQHITNADWSIVVRRISEMLMMNFPLLIVFGIPLVLGMHDLYHWTHESLYIEGGEDFDRVLAGKRGYLNIPFFLARMAIYFGSWTYMSYRLYSISIAQDVDPSPERAAAARRVSAWGLVVFAFTMAFAGFDLLMSLDPHWFSTMFGVYFFSGIFYVALAAIALMAFSLQRGGYLADVITAEHYHDLGKFMFGFAGFWAYIAFSQYMLIWYANLPEETIWFRHRLDGSWGPATTLLIFWHFVIPFIVLMFRAAKRSRLVLGTMTLWFLVAHFMDLYWLAMPVLDHHFAVEIIDVTMWLGMCFFFAGIVVLRTSRHATVPYNDPRFKMSLAFENA